MSRTFTTYAPVFSAAMLAKPVFQREMAMGRAFPCGWTPLTDGRVAVEGNTRPRAVRGLSLKPVGCIDFHEMLGGQADELGSDVPHRGIDYCDPSNPIHY